MSKKLITKVNVHDYICENKFYKEKNMIINPGVLDYLKEKNIKIVQHIDNTCTISDDKNVKPTIDINLVADESLDDKIKRILLNDFNINDNVTIDKIIKIVKGVVK